MTSTQDTGWHWPSDIGGPPDRSRSSGTDYTSIPGAFYEDLAETRTAEPQERTTSSQSNPQKPRGSRIWPPRTCRICLETVLPTFNQPSAALPNVFQPAPTVTYESDDPTAGRLIRPCKCKGSSRYVHEGCLQAWRHADPEYGKRNYWQCPTCGFRYRLERMRWGRAISSTLTQIVLTIFILLFTMFALGFVADPIINLYLDPYSTISSGSFSDLGIKIEPILTDDDVPGWAEHFLKGLASLGMLSFIKVLFASPWQWWNLRNSGIMSGGRRTGTDGRDRLANTTWILILIGVGTFLWVHQIP